MTLERGLARDDILAWALKTWNFGAGLGAEVSLKDFRKDIILEVYNEAGQLALAYNIFRCWVSEYRQSDLDANANAVAIEHIKLENEGWRLRYGRPRASRTAVRRRDVQKGRLAVITSTPHRAARLGAVACRSRRCGAPSHCSNWPSRRSGGGDHHALPIGGRDRELLQLPGVRFRRAVAGLVACPACTQTVGTSGATNTIIASVPCAAPDSEELTFDRDGYRVSFRLPTSEDLIALGASAAQTQPERFLLARCLRWVEIRRLAGGGQRTAGGNHRADRVERMNEHDPLADIELACVCPRVRHRGPRRWTS